MSKTQSSKYILISLYGFTPQIAQLASVPNSALGLWAQSPASPRPTDCKLDCAKVKESKPMRLSTTQVSPYHARSNNRYAKFKIKINLVWDWSKILVKKNFQKQRRNGPEKWFPHYWNLGPVTWPAIAVTSISLSWGFELICCVLQCSWNLDFRKVLFVTQFNINYNCFYYFKKYIVKKYIRWENLK